MRQLLLLLLLLTALPLAAADLSGIWIGQLNTQDVAFQLVQKGDTLSGKLYGDYRSTPIIEGKVAGDDFTFVVVAEEQAGNQISQTRVLFAGKLTDGKLEISRQRQSSTNAGNSGGAQVRKNSKQAFTLKRLL